MSTLRNTGLAAVAFAVLSLAAAFPACAQSAGSIQAGYDAANDVMLLKINNSFFQDFTNVTLTETLLADPSVTDSVNLGTIGAGKSATSDVDFLFPVTFGDNPDDLFVGQPFDVTLTADYLGATHTVTFNQDNNATGGYVQFEGIGEGPNGIDDLPVSLTKVADFAVPEPGSLGLLVGSGFVGAGFLLRRRLRK